MYGLRISVPNMQFPLSNRESKTLLIRLLITPTTQSLNDKGPGRFENSTNTKPRAQIVVQMNMTILNMPRKHKLICICNQVSTKEIDRILKKNPLYGFDEVKLATGASTSCGRCRNELEAYIECERSGKVSPQLRLF